MAFSRLGQCLRLRFRVLGGRRFEGHPIRPTTRASSSRRPSSTLKRCRNKASTSASGIREGGHQGDGVAPQDGQQGLDVADVEILQLVERPHHLDLGLAPDAVDEGDEDHAQDQIGQAVEETRSKSAALRKVRV
jgi:hypothetical protein